MKAASTEAATASDRVSGFEPGGALFWLPAVILLLISTVLAVVDVRAVFDPPLLLAALNVLVFIGVSLVVAALAGQAFINGGSPTLLLLGAGTLAFGTASVIGSLLINAGQIDAGVAAHNTITLVAAGAHSVSAVIVWRALPIDGRRFTVLAATYSLILTSSIMLTALATSQHLPPFVTEGGATTLRMTLLMTSAVLYVGSATAFNIRASRTQAGFLHWYAMGLALIGIGLVSVALGPVNSPIGWVGRLEQAAGQVYILMCLLVILRESPAPSADAISQSFSRADRALRSLEARYATLFDSVSDSVVVHRLGTEREPGAFVDFNAAFVKLLGFNEAQLSRISPDSLVEPEQSGFSTSLQSTDGMSALYETRLRRRDGSSVPVEIHTRRLKPDEEVALSVIRDISEREAAELKREMELVRLRQLLDEATTGFNLADEEGRVVVMNKAMERLWGRPLALANSTSEYWMYPAVHHGTDRTVAADEWPASVVLAGAESAELLADITRPDGELITARFRATPVSTRAHGLGNVLTSGDDVTEEMEQARLIRELDTIRTLVTSTFDADEIERRITYMGSDALRCDGALLLGNSSSGWTTVDGFGGLRDALGADVKLDDRLLTQAATLRRAVSCPGPDCKASDLPAWLSQRGFRSAVFVPIIAQGGVVGMSIFGWRADRSPIGYRTDFSNRLLGVVALALDNSEAYQRERLIADTLQQVIISVPTEIRGVEWSHLYRPASAEANVGGDFYDIFELENEDIVIMVGDVSGKGVAAAKLTSLLRDGARAYAMLDDDPGIVLTRLNNLIYKYSSAETFATLFYGVLRRSSGELRYCSAGHTPAIVASSGCATELIEPTDPICGAFLDIVYRTKARHLQPGDRVVLYTDGMTEARRGTEMFGEQRLAQVVESLCDSDVDDIPEDLLATVEAFTDGNLSDDVVIICVSLVEDGRDHPGI